ncbi:unnamed protein product [Microthlaspi erraticum]|uniref:Reverse transcriptase Ty1/copia-type domain-containing protein n=1 Tax=Microthlaspi erraticum TaxID=1685480 RepID=A0A6D2KVB1_9BRAS|nr:unnamed protein product [Microthlaspi erraticum]
MIARPLLMRSQLPVSAWGHAILHAATLIRIRPTSNHKFSPLQLVLGKEPNISHLKVFGCTVYVPIAPPQRSKMGPQRRLEYMLDMILINHKYLEPSTGDLFKARYADCHFNESVFPTLGEETKQLGKEISWNELSLSYLDPRTKESENAPIRLNVQKGIIRLLQSLRHARSVVDLLVPKINPRKRKGAEIGNSETEVTTNERSPEETLHMTEIQVPENEEISINYVMSGIKWNRKEIDVDEIFAYNVAIDIMDEDHEPTSIAECMQRIDWPKWNEAIDAEFNSLGKREVFGPVVRTPEGRMWYNRLSEYLLKEGYKNDLISPCIFIRKFGKGFVIIAVYVDDLNIIGTPEEISYTVEYLKKEFEMKDLGKTKFCLGLQIEHLVDGILLHQMAYTEKILKRFFMDQSHPLSSPMIVRSLDVLKDPFRPRKTMKKLLVLKYHT